MENRWKKVPVFVRNNLNPGARINGFAIILDNHSAAVIEKDWKIIIDNNSTGLITVLDETVKPLIETGTLRKENKEVEGDSMTSMTLFITMWELFKQGKFEEATMHWNKNHQEDFLKELNSRRYLKYWISKI